MSDRSIWWYTRNITTALSFVNVLAVYIQKIIDGASSIHTILNDQNTRIRFWATAVLLTITGIVALGYLIHSTKDVSSDLQVGSMRQRIVALSFGAGQLVAAALIAGMLIAS